MSVRFEPPLRHGQVRVLLRDGGSSRARLLGLLARGVGSVRLGSSRFLNWSGRRSLRRWFASRRLLSVACRCLLSGWLGFRCRLLQVLFHLAQLLLEELLARIIEIDGAMLVFPRLQGSRWIFRQGLCAERRMMTRLGTEFGRTAKSLTENNIIERASLGCQRTSASHTEARQRHKSINIMRAIRRR